jgi:hypothetical protein
VGDQLPRRAPADDVAYSPRRAGMLAATLTVAALVCLALLAVTGTALLAPAAVICAMGGSLALAAARSAPPAPPDGLADLELIRQLP